MGTSPLCDICWNRAPMQTASTWCALEHPARPLPSSALIQPCRIRGWLTKVVIVHRNTFHISKAQCQPILWSVLIAVELD